MHLLRADLLGEHSLFDYPLSLMNLISINKRSRRFEVDGYVVRLTPHNIFKYMLDNIFEHQVHNNSGDRISAARISEAGHVEMTGFDRFWLRSERK